MLNKVFKMITPILFVLLSASYGSEPSMSDSGLVWDDGKIRTMKKRKAEAELRAAYEKRFGKPITDRELFTSSVSLNFGKGYGFDDRSKSYIDVDVERSATKTTAMASFSLRDKSAGPETYYFNVELSMEEWLDFVHALHKIRFDKWRKDYIRMPFLLLPFTRKGKDYDATPPDNIVVPDNMFFLIFALVAIGHRTDWDFAVGYHSDEIPYKYVVGFNAYPRDWLKLRKIMNGMSKKIEGKMLAKKQETDSILSAEYQKRFGEPITDFELSFSKIWFVNGERNGGRHYDVKVNRNILDTGARGVLKSSSDEYAFRADLGMEDWLDFVRSMRLCGVHEWKKKYYGSYGSGTEWWSPQISFHTQFRSRDKKKPFKNPAHYWVEDGGTYPENWSEFKKTMDGMIEKIKELAPPE